MSEGRPFSTPSFPPPLPLAPPGRPPFCSVPPPLPPPLPSFSPGEIRSFLVPLLGLTLTLSLAQRMRATRLRSSLAVHQSGPPSCSKREIRRRFDQQILPEPKFLFFPLFPHFSPFFPRFLFFPQFLFFPLFPFQTFLKNNSQKKFKQKF